MSSPHRHLLEYAKEMSGEVALEAAHRLALTLAFRDPPVDVDNRLSVNFLSGDDDLMQGTVEPAVPAVIEAPAHYLARGGRDGCNSCESGGGSLEPG